MALNGIMRSFRKASGITRASISGRNINTSASASATKEIAAKEAIPDVMVTFGNPPAHMTFLSHPGVMAIVKLLEMKYITSPRARLTQENVDAIREFDSNLADKCQLAVDAEIDINFMDLDHLDKPEFLQQFLQEKEILNAARAEVLSSSPGDYRIPYYARTWEKPAVRRQWRPEMTVTQEMLATEPDLVKDIELQSIVSEYLRNKGSNNDPDEVLHDGADPIAEKADETRQTKQNAARKSSSVRFAKGKKGGMQTKEPAPADEKHA